MMKQDRDQDRIRRGHVHACGGGGWGIDNIYMCRCPDFVLLILSSLPPHSGLSIPSVQHAPASFLPAAAAATPAVWRGGCREHSKQIDYCHRGELRCVPACLYIHRISLPPTGTAVLGPQVTEKPRTLLPAYHAMAMCQQDGRRREKRAGKD